MSASLHEMLPYLGVRFYVVLQLHITTTSYWVRHILCFVLCWEIGHLQKLITFVICQLSILCLTCLLQMLHCISLEIGSVSLQFDGLPIDSKHLWLILHCAAIILICYNYSYLLQALSFLCQICCNFLKCDKFHDVCNWVHIFVLQLSRCAATFLWCCNFFPYTCFWFPVTFRTPFV